MISFTHLKSTQCPACSCDVIVIEELEKSHNNKILQHCNGQRWEKRSFLCGTRIEWIPNFSREEVKGECLNSLSVKEKIKKQEEIRAKIKLLEQELYNVTYSK